MLKQVRLENFKGLKKAQVDLGRITVLIGPNGMSKSSISHALMALRQSIGSEDLKVNGPLINLGDFNDVLNKEAVDGQVQIGISVDVTSLYLPKNSLFSYDAYFLPHLTSFNAVLGTTKQNYFEFNLEEGQFTSTPPELFVETSQSTNIHIEIKNKAVIAMPIIARAVSPPAKLAHEAQKITKELNALFSAIKNTLSNTYYVHAIRGFERANYELDANPTTDFKPSGEVQLASTFAYAGRDIEEIVSRWTELITGSRISPSIVPGRKVTVKSYVVKNGVPIIGDGFGTNQLVWLLLTLAITPNQSLLAIEEPEVHLHPKAQRELCNILVNTAKEQDKQLLITTHSEHILYAFVQAVKNKTLTRNDLAIYYFEGKGEAPKRIEQDGYGDIYDWGKHFFTHS